jgi:6-phosphogluconolactonase (cycloisomerase 2 family)
MRTTKKSRNGKILFLLIILAFTGYSDINAQYETSQWFFGQGAGIDFRSGVSKPIIGSKINTIEGCSTISDSNGNLLFYTDGITVWNKNHKEMPNGRNLNGSISATQSTIIIPLPESNSIFYIFTVDSEGGKGGFCYSIADMTKENGLGDITLKNKLINSGFTEKLVSVKQPGTTNFWVITHKYGSNAFFAYLLTKSGLSTEPVVSNIGLKHENSIFNAIGYMKVSPDKTKLALAINGNKIIQLFKFAASEGTVSNPISLNLKDYSNPYGLEFSPNSNFLYISTPANGSVYQTNTETYNEQALQKSLILVGQSKNKKSLGALQLGPNGKIYVAEYESKYLSVINKPDLLGTDCSFQQQAIALGGNICKLGLPTFVQDFASATRPVSYTHLTLPTN